MKSENAIEVHDVKKSFKVYFDKGGTIKEKVLFKNRRRFENREVLKGISFEVKKGEAIGLIGHNGCGKSTMLKLLTKIIYPDSGCVDVLGRVSSLIELGAGFHPDMTGRENIYINASIFGLTKKEIDRRMADIIAFSELEDYIDTPVRTYSSGMYMRLAFSVAINVDADVLLIDEILAVGDVTFQAKCFNKLREKKAMGTTIVIVSHSLGQIEQICDRCIWIDNGEIKMDGVPVEVDFAYLDYMGEKATEKSDKIEAESAKEEISEAESEPEECDESELIKKMYHEGKKLIISSAELLHENGEKGNRFKVGEPVILRVAYKKLDSVKEAMMGIKIYRNDNTNAYGTNTQNERVNVVLFNNGIVECRFASLNLISAQYKVDIAFRSMDMMIFDYKTNIIEFETFDSLYEEGVARLNHSWNFYEEDLHDS